MQPGGVPPVDPAHRGQLYRLGGLPHPFRVDEFGFVESVDRLG